MKQAKVSAEFLSVFHQNTSAVEQAKAAESRTGNIPVPVGTTGTCVIDDMRFDRSPEKKLPDGTTKPGTPLFEITYRILDGDHAGKTIKHVQWMWSNATTSFADQYERVLNLLEKHGLPREVRTGHSQPNDLFTWFSENDNLTYHFEIKHNPRNELDDGKQISVQLLAAELPMNADVMPPPQQPVAPVTTTAPATSAPSAEIKAGSVVTFNGAQYTVKEVYPTGKAYLTSVSNPSDETLAPVSALSL